MSGRELVVTRHAVAAYSRRRNDARSLRLLAAVNWNPDIVRRSYGAETADRLIIFYNELEREIAECVQYALDNGLTERRKPPGFVLYRRKRDALPDGQRFVRCEEDSPYGFIVQRDPGGKDVVLTTISRVGVRK
jgi:hypothetical protein